MNFSDRQIWLFREMRSGSDWVWKTLETKLNRTCLHFSKESSANLNENSISHLFYNDEDPNIILKKNVDKLSDVTKFYSTHYFHILPYIDCLDNPYLIRTVRRDKAEQCMSLLYFYMYGNKFHHVHAENKDNTNYNLFLESLSNPVEILKQQVQQIMLSLKKNDDCWKEYSKNYENCVIVYEDLFEGVTLKQVDLTLKFNSSFVYKTPDYKKKFFINYDQIVEWSKYYESLYGFENY